MLAFHLAQWGFVLVDNKWLTGTTAQMGFHEIPRAEYSRQLAELADAPCGAPDGRWEAVSDGKAAAEWRPRERQSSVG